MPTNPAVHLRAWGELACFTRPEMKVERVSYSVMTPSAARGLLESILYKPQFRWRIHRIAVWKPVRFLAFRRNEVKSRAAARNPLPINVEEDRTQRNTLALRDVEYVIEASITLTRLANLPRQKPADEDEPDRGDNLAKYYGMFHRRAEKGQCFAQPCFGCREFPAHFELADALAMNVPPGLNLDASLGLMLYDVFDLDIGPDYRAGKIEAKPQISFFRAGLHNGHLVEEGREALPEWERMKTQPEAGGAA
jgi:CRISPR-associated protein Cas5d